MTAEKDGVAFVARIRRALDSGADAPGVLEAAGLTEAGWAALEEEVMGSIGEELDRGEGRRLEEYSAAYASTAAPAAGSPALAAAPPPPSSIATTSEPPAKSVAEPVLASYQRVPIPEAPISPDDTAQVDVRNIVAGIRGAAGPFDPNAPVRKPVPVPIADEQSGSTMIADVRQLLKREPPVVPFAERGAAAPASVPTEAIDFEAVQKMLAKAPTPFSGTAAPPPPPPAPTPDPPAPTSVATEAIDFEAVQKMLAKAPTPFSATAAAPPAAPTSVATEAIDFEAVQKMLAKAPTPFSATAAPPPPAPTSVATEAIDFEAVQKMLGNEPTPFSGRAAPPPSIPVRPESTGASRHQLPTEEIRFAPASVALPFDSKAHEGPMTIERYAQIQAAITTDPDPGSVLGRFGVSLQEWGAVHTDMRARFKADPALRERYEQLFREATQK